MFISFAGLHYVCKMLNNETNDLKRIIYPNYLKAKNILLPSTESRGRVHAVW